MNRKTPAKGTQRDHVNCPSCGMKIVRNLTRHSLIPHNVLCTCGTLVQLVDLKKVTSVGNVNVQGIEATSRPI